MISRVLGPSFDPTIASALLMVVASSLSVESPDGFGPGREVGFGVTGGGLGAGVFRVLFGVGAAGVVVVASVGPFLVVVEVEVDGVAGGTGGVGESPQGVPQVSDFSRQYIKYFSLVGFLGFVNLKPLPQPTEHGLTSTRSVTLSQMVLH